MRKELFLEIVANILFDDYVVIIMLQKVSRVAPMSVVKTYGVEAPRQFEGIECFR